ncbi:hypothetical protein [Candidatus Ornithobacterium hominis]|uniref:hypothetical protein n=1 Tax=Candidatus Ornithobacterium hominis TaxID=2497989 RepID=UPI0024BC804E|nr:hypothetical protein [Candidatus Ornithobacterium hominis]
MARRNRRMTSRNATLPRRNRRQDLYIRQPASIAHLQKRNVNNLDQIKWIFDGQKAPADFKEKMIK